MPLVTLHHLLNVSVQLPNKRGFKKKIQYNDVLQHNISLSCEGFPTVFSSKPSLPKIAVNFSSPSCMLLVYLGAIIFLRSYFFKSTDYVLLNIYFLRPYVTTFHFRNFNVNYVLIVKFICNQQVLVNLPSDMNFFF
jgi:hypothetical protein